MSHLTTTLVFSVADKDRCVKVVCGDYSEMYDKPMIKNDPGMFALIVENFCLAKVIEDGADIEFVFEDEEDLRSIARNEFELTSKAIHCQCHDHKVTIR